MHGFFEGDVANGHDNVLQRDRFEPVFGEEAGAAPQHGCFVRAHGKGQRFGFSAGGRGVSTAGLHAGYPVIRLAGQ